jgi:hypothetical protein
MHTFQIKVLIRFLTSSNCFETRGLIIRKPVGIRSFCTVYFSCTYVISLAGGRVSIYNLPPTRLLTPMHNKHDVKNCFYTLPDDAPMSFETYRRRQNSNPNINLKSVHFVGLCCILVLKCTVQKTLKNYKLSQIFGPHSNDHFRANKKCIQ